MAKPSSQNRFVFGSLVCNVCPYGIAGRCEGEISATPESFTLNDSSVIGCLDPAKQTLHFADLHGRARLPKQKSRHSEISLPAFIPQLCTGLGDLRKVNGHPLFAVSLSTLLSEEGKVKFRSAQSLRRALGLPPDARLALVGTTKDYTIEKFWTHSEASNAWKRIAELGFEFSTSLSYSVWDEHPRFDQIFNQQKNLNTQDVLLASGVISIPFLFFYDRRDYREVISWLNSHKDVRKVAILAQFKRTETGFEDVIREMHRLETDIARRLHFLVIGPSKGNRIRRIFSEFPNVTIVTIQPAFKASRNRRTLSDLRHVEADIRISKSDLAVSNMETYWKFCSRARRATRTRRKSPTRSSPLFSRLVV
jgi:hypothetical protein